MIKSISGYKIQLKGYHFSRIDFAFEVYYGIPQTRNDEIEDLRDAIDDRYPFENLFLKWAELDDEEEPIKTASSAP